MLIRMLGNMNKWDVPDFQDWPNVFIPGDTIADLRTTDNTLSVWIANSQEDINDALVALALNRKSVGKLVYCFIDDNDLENLNIKISDSIKGLAPGLDDDILVKHRDLVEIDFWRIGYLAAYMLRRLKIEGNRKFLTASQVKELLTRYKDDSKIDVENMNEDLRKSLKW